MASAMSPVRKAQNPSVNGLTRALDLWQRSKVLPKN